MCWKFNNEYAIEQYSPAFLSANAALQADLLPGTLLGWDTPSFEFDVTTMMGLNQKAGLPVSKELLDSSSKFMTEIEPSIQNNNMD